MRYLIITTALFAAFASPVCAKTADDIAHGAAIYAAHCALCHDNSEHMLNDNGPALFGVVGRPVASVQGYRYSPALKAASKGKAVWSVKRLDRFLTQPSHMYPGTGMPMNFDKASDRRAIIAYLKTLKAEN